jgi:hypothetical protein
MKLRSRIRAALGRRLARLRGAAWGGVARGMGKPIVVFDIETAGLREHFDPLIDWLVERGECTVVLSVEDSEACAYWLQRRRRRGVLRLTKSELAGLGSVPAVTVSFHPENGSPLAERLAGKGTWRVVMQHGLSDKLAFGDIGKRDPLGDFDVLFLSGAAFREGSLSGYRKRYPDTYDRLRIEEIGAIRTDVLFRSVTEREGVLVELGLDPGLPTVCYAPTWERTASLEQHGIAIVSALAALPVNVIVKLHHVSLCTANHPWIVQDGHGGKDWRRILREQERQYPNVRLAPGHDAAPYLLASDLLVSDASGIAYEFLLLDRPIVFMDVPELFSHYGRDGIHFWGRACGDVVSDPDALAAAVMANLRDPERKRSDRERLIPRVSYARGDATARAGNAILSLVRKGPRH